MGPKKKTKRGARIPNIIEQGLDPLSTENEEDYVDEKHREIERRSIMLGMEKKEAVASTPEERVCSLPAFNTPKLSPSEYSNLSSSTTSTNRTLHIANSSTKTSEVILSYRTCGFDDILIGLNHLSYYF